MLIKNTDKETLPPMNKERIGLRLNHLVHIVIPAPGQEEKTEEGLGEQPVETKNLSLVDQRQHNDWVYLE